VVFTAICGIAAWFAAAGRADSSAPWFSIVPPVLAIVLAFLTHHVMISLGVAVLAGGLLTTVPGAPADFASWTAGLKTVGAHIANTASDPTNLLILSFIPPIFAMVEVVIASGGFKGVVLWLLKRVRSRKSAQAATAHTGKPSM